MTYTGLSYLGESIKSGITNITVSRTEYFYYNFTPLLLKGDYFFVPSVGYASLQQNDAFETLPDDYRQITGYSSSMIASESRWYITTPKLPEDWGQIYEVTLLHPNKENNLFFILVCVGALTSGVIFAALYERFMKN